MHQPPVWTPPSPEQSELQALVHRREALEQRRQMEHNRRQALEPTQTAGAVRGLLQERLAFLEQQIDKTRHLIQEHIDSHPGLRDQAQLLTSIPGIGQATTAALLAEIVDGAQFSSARQVAAFAGLVPKIRQSGTSVRGRATLSKIGSARLRKSLYFPAMVALRFNPAIKAMGERLSQSDKSKMLILGAAMRKLLHIVFGVLKSGKKFDPALAQPA